MVGVIRTWDLLFHPWVTVRCFGWQTFYRAMFAGREQTFLSLLGERSFFDSANSEAAAILQRCVGLELQAGRIYAALAEATVEASPLAQFFAKLARQEEEHAHLLKLCMAAARRGGWKLGCFNPWRDYLPRLERQMHEVESSLSKIDGVESALRLVIQIESSELNQVFQAVMAASDAGFVKRLRPFRHAVQRHINYIVTEVPHLAPHLMTVSRELRARFVGRV
jgi:hypothetical protein